MEINGINNYLRISQPAAQRSIARPAAESAPAAETRADKVAFSSEGSFKAQLGTYARAFAAESGKAASAERINRLKQQYQGDSCPVSGADIASAVLKYSLGAAVNVN